MVYATKSLLYGLPVAALAVAVEAGPVHYKQRRALKDIVRTLKASSHSLPLLTFTKSSSAQVATGINPAFITFDQAGKASLNTGTEVLKTRAIEVNIEAMAPYGFETPDASTTEDHAAGQPAQPAQLKKRAWSKKKIFGTLAAGAAAAGAIFAADHSSQSIGENSGSLANTNELVPAIGMNYIAPAVVPGSVPQAIGYAPSIVDSVVIESSRNSVDSSRDSVDSDRNSLESDRKSIESFRESIESGPRPVTPVADQPFQHSAKYRPVFEKWQTAEKLNGNPLIPEGNPFIHTGAVHM